MFDTMTMTKIVGGLCGTLLIFLFANWAGTSIYATGAEAHGDGEVVQGYMIATAEGEGAAEEEEVVEVAFADVFAGADAAKGEKVFSKCKACHKVDGSNGTGPHLDGVVNRAIGGVAEYSYSDAMASHGGDWTPEALNAFLESPKGYVPGTKMSFAGLNKVEDRANLIAWLQGL